MTRVEILTRLESVFSDVLGRPVVLTDETTSENLDGWDSFAHITLVSAIEDEFGVRFAMAEIPDLLSVSAILARLASD